MMKIIFFSRKGENMDKLSIGIARNGNVRIYAVVSTELTEEARRRHDLWPTSSATLGRTMAVGLMMGAMAKGKDERVGIEIIGEGPIGKVQVDADTHGNVRGYVGDPHVMLSYNDTNKLAVGLAVGPGYLKVTKDMNLRSDFVGTTDLVSGEIAEDFAYYFNVSEQTPSVVSLGVLVDTDNTIISAGGLIIQLMPGYSEEDIVATEKAIENLKPVSELIKNGETSETLITNLFEDAKVLDERDVQFKCTCSRERMHNGLATLQNSDLLEMIVDNENVETVCNFCNEKYIFTVEDLKELLDAKVADNR